jgi:uncharacterized membrane protein
MPDRFVAAAYGSLAEADAALRAAEEVDLHDAAIVVRDANGRIDLRQMRETSIGEGAVAGGTVGLLAGLFLGLPVGAALAGLLAGGGFGARDTGIANDRLRKLGEGLQPGHAVVCVLVDEEKLPGVVERLVAHGGEAVDTAVPPP